MRKFVSILTVFLSSCYFSVSSFAAENVAVPAEEAADIKDTLLILGQGMLGVLVVMSVIFLSIVLLNAITTKKTDKNNEDNEEQNNG